MLSVVVQDDGCLLPIGTDALSSFIDRVVRLGGVRGAADVLGVDIHQHAPKIGRSRAGKRLLMRSFPA